MARWFGSGGQTGSENARLCACCQTTLAGADALRGIALAAGALRLANRCLDPAATPVFELETAAWQDIDPAEWWDCHVHIVGSGDGGSGIVLNPAMRSPFRHPLQTLQYRAYANAACVGRSGQDAGFVNRLQALLAGMPAGAKTMLFAFDRVHLADGAADTANSAFYVPNEYARQLAQSHPECFEWVASIHPYRRDCVEALESAVAGGARAVKWLPPAMGIDPASPQCDAFFRALARLNLPLITHGGAELALHGADRPAFGNPLRLRRALDAGVKVVVAHCATLGKDRNERGRQVASFDLFCRLMAENQWREQLCGDISAIVLRNRDPALIKTLLSETAWHDRLLYGSDYPLTGILPLISPAGLAKAGLLEEDMVKPLKALQDYHPLRFDFVLKRSLSWQGKRFAPTVFATRRFFAPELDENSPANLAPNQ